MGQNLRILGLQARHIESAPVPMCISGVLAMRIFGYFLCMFDAFFFSKVYFFYALGTCVSPRRIFFTPWAPLSCRCISFTPVWISALYVYCGCIFLPARCAFFCKRIFGRQLLKQRPNFAANVFWPHMFF